MCHVVTYSGNTWAAIGSVSTTSAGSTFSGTIYDNNACSGTIVEQSTNQALVNCGLDSLVNARVVTSTGACPSTGGGSSSSSKCFPANATVLLENGETKAVSDLRVGDSVLAAPGVYSQVYMFSHRLADTNSAFVTLTAGVDTVLQLTHDHYLYVNGALATAGTVRVGDMVTLASGSRATVTAVSTAWASGLYNPHTLHGDIVVNGVVTSTYTKAIAPGIAHAALWPVRALFAAGIQLDSDAFANGGDALTAVMPKGLDKY